MPAIPADGNVHPRKRGRPKGSGTGGMQKTFAARITPEMELYLGRLGKRLKCNGTTLFRKAIRALAEKVNFEQPPSK